MLDDMGTQSTVTTQAPKLICNSRLRAYGLAVLRPYNLYVCVSPDCKVGIPRDHVVKHMEKQHDSTFKEDIATRFSDYYNIKSSDEVLIPRDFVAPIPGLTTLPGYYCSNCHWKSSRRDGMLAHIRSPGHSTEDSGIACTLQTLCAPTHGGYIMVPTPPPPPTDDPYLLLEAEMAKNSQLYHLPIVDQNDPKSLNPFIVTSTWGKWLGDMSVSAVETMQKNMKASYETRQDCAGLVKGMWDSCNAETYIPRCMINSPTCVLSLYFLHNITLT